MGWDGKVTLVSQLPPHSISVIMWIRTVQSNLSSSGDTSAPASRSLLENAGQPPCRKGCTHAPGILIEELDL